MWPDGQVIGEALRQLSILLAEDFQVEVVGQSRSKGKASADGASSLSAKIARSWASSSSSISVRIFDAIFFGFWVVFRLLLFRPRRVYVATDPPVIIPFIAACYCRLTGAKLLYHVQDIHPEIANTLLEMNPIVYKALASLDCFALRSSAAIVTLSDDMRKTLIGREAGVPSVEILPNPAIFFQSTCDNKDLDFVFCGNAGRLQLIPDLVAGIELYLSLGGGMRFDFAGGGANVEMIIELASKFDSVTYHGLLDAESAMVLMQRGRWGLMPISTSIACLAFPSKSSSYLMAGCSIVCISEQETSIASWVESNDFGIAVSSSPIHLAELFRRVEFSPQSYIAGYSRKELADVFSVSSFASRLAQKIAKM